MHNSISSVPDFGVFKQARKEGYGTVSLFGVLHFGNPHMYPLPETVDRAFGMAEAIAFETDLDALAKTDFGDAMEESGTDCDKTALRESLTPETWRRTLLAAADLGFSEDFIAKLKPWYCAAIMTSAAMRKTGLDSCMGIDATLFQRARDERKTIICLESPQEQLELLKNLRQEETEAFMKQTLDEIEDMPAFTRNMLKHWMENNQEELAELIHEGFAKAPGLQYTLLDGRNLNWFQELSQAAQKNKTVLAVVGAGHLVGATSLPILFRQHGFQVNDCAGKPQPSSPQDRHH